MLKGSYRTYMIGFLILAMNTILLTFWSSSWAADSNERTIRNNPKSRFVDCDRDGYPSTVDCNDRNASIYPGVSIPAREVCD